MGDEFSDAGGGGGGGGRLWLTRDEVLTDSVLTMLAAVVQQHTNADSITRGHHSLSLIINMHDI